MRLLTGPAGSGKTNILLNQFREALRAGGEGIRLLTPTATLAQHLQNEVAREGLVFHRNLIQTLNAFVEESAGGGRLAEQPVLYLLVEQAARRLRRPGFARRVETAGGGGAAGAGLGAGGGSGGMRRGAGGAHGGVGAAGGRHPAAGGVSAGYTT